MRIEKTKVMNNDKSALDAYLLMVERTTDGLHRIEEVDGFYELVAVEPTPVESTPLDKIYSQRVVELIRERYTQDDEYAILRKRLANIDTNNEFLDYNNYCEECKALAKAEVYKEEADVNTEG